MQYVEIKSEWLNGELLMRNKGTLLGNCNCSLRYEILIIVALFLGAFYNLIAYQNTYDL